MRCSLPPTLIFVLLASALFGCVRRTITIDSSPSGALVWLNDQEVGRTPVTVDFLYYGDYDVRLEHEDAEPLMTHGVAAPPLWDVLPLDLIAELAPLPFHSRVQWHYELPTRRDDPEQLRSRAEELRSRIGAGGEAEEPETGEIAADESPG